MHLDWKDMKERVQRTLALVLTLLLVFSTVLLPGAGAAVTKSQINDLKSKATSLASEKAKLQTQLDKLSNSKNAAVDQKRVLEQKINVLQEEIAVSEQSIAKLAEMISQKEQELADAQAEEARYYDLFIDRVRNMEENGEVSYWAVIFDARNFSDLLDRVSMIQEIMD
ncbi:MAG: peptidase M23, partial [Ruminiclostridium sp.]|nr:peptidase M23 [Ruminiclostridium sp.]